MSEVSLIYSFDSTTSVRGQIQEPDSYGQLAQLLGQNKLIPRGAGSSYVLASAADASVSVSMKAFNRILSFNADQKEIEVEAGLSIGELLLFLKQRKLWFSVLPGHPSITVGGCLAFNIHGKGQFKQGCFKEYVISFELLTPKGEKLHCSKNQNSELFELTVGGMGLTGIILSVKLRCQNLQGQSLKREKVAVKDLLTAADVLLQKKDQYESVYSWNDLNKKGQGFVFLESFSEQAKRDIDSFSKLVPPPRRSLVHSFMKLIFLKRTSFLYKVKEWLSGREQILGLIEGAFPFNGKEIYHRFFADQGLIEYQMLLPFSSYREALAAIQEKISEKNIYISLGSLKVFQGTRRYLQFNGEGICLALDAPYSPESLKLFSEIDDIVIQYQGLANISKDSRLTAETIRAMYSEQYHSFKKKILSLDPEKKMQSHVRQRLEI